MHSFFHITFMFKQILFTLYNNNNTKPTTNNDDGAIVQTFTNIRLYILLSIVKIVKYIEGCPMI